jgi:hypothetical protein
MSDIECLPRTEEGIRRLALIVVMSEIDGAQGILDSLELRILKALRIKPDGLGRDEEDEVEPIQIEHVRRRGERLLRVRWRFTKWAKCDECYGRGYLRASGASGKSHEVECPECYGMGTVENEQEDILTDIDGNRWRKAA